MFALQYLRASLTVPLFFERQIQKISNANFKLQEFDEKIRNRNLSVIAAQVVLLVSGLILSAAYAYQWYESIDGQWASSHLFQWAKEYEWLRISQQLLICSSIFNFISLSAILAALFLIKKWIRDELDGQRRWRCSVDGNFLLYFVLLLVLAFVQAAVSIWISTGDQDEFSKRIHDWGTAPNDDFY